jgi:hypothetical protein
MPTPPPFAKVARDRANNTREGDSMNRTQVITAVALALI